MTTTYDPAHALYTDEADVRDAMRLAFDVCRDCRRCTDLCTSFPTLFEMLDGAADGDAGAMTPAQQDLVVDGCFQCKQCAVGCPALSTDRLDFPRLMLRASAMRHVNGHKTSSERIATRVVGRADSIGKLATATSAITKIANRVVASKPDSRLRRVVTRLSGMSPTQALAPYAQERFSTWFAQRPKIVMGKKRGSVTVYPTCLVEYRATDVGTDLVKVYERNGIECSTSGARCCGAPALHAGDLKRFGKIARRNVRTLAAEVRAGTDIVVAQPTCGYVLKNDYVDHVANDEARLVAEHTFDASEYLMRLHNADDTVLDTDFAGATPRTITYHTPSHLTAQNIGFKSRDLMKLTGARVRMVRRSSGVESTWQLRRGNDEATMPFVERVAGEIAAGEADVTAGDCHLSNTAVEAAHGVHIAHPVQVIARAYGIPADR